MVYNLSNAFKSYARYTVTDVAGEVHVLAVRNRRESVPSIVIFFIIVGSGAMQ